MKANKRNNLLIIKYIIIIIFSILILISFIFLITTKYIEYKEKKDYESLADYIVNNENQGIFMDSSQAKAKDKDKAEKILKLEELNNQYKDVVAWLEIPGTSINYPVVQAQDNVYYLDHTYKKTYSSRGSIFLDKDVSFEKPSDNFLIYGHRSKSGTMFEGLLEYENESFYQEHKIINFSTLQEDSEYEILAVFRSRVYNKSDTNVFRYYFFINAENESEYNNFVLNSKKASLYDTDVNASYGEQLLTLSTCAYHTEDGRFVIVAKKKTNIN